MKILVTGDRNWDNLYVMYDVLKTLPTDTTLIHGYADGADMCAHVIGQELGFIVIPCPAHWSCNNKRWREVYGPCDHPCHHVSGRPAGAIRNRYMLRTHVPDLVLAFHDNIKESKGTKDMVQIAMAAHVPVTLYTYKGFEVDIYIPT